MKEQHDNREREPLRFLVFSASLRNDSLNTRLVALAASVIEKNGSKVSLATMSEFDCPSYNQDVEMKGAFLEEPNTSDSSSWQMMRLLFHRRNIMPQCREISKTLLNGYRGFVPNRLTNVMLCLCLLLRQWWAATAGFGL